MKLQDKIVKIIIVPGKRVGMSSVSLQLGKRMEQMWKNEKV